MGWSKQGDWSVARVLSHDDDRKLALDCKSTDPYVRDSARKRLQNLLKEQGDPEKELYTEPASNNISIECPVWSHVRKSNPRGKDGALKENYIQARISFHDRCR